MEEPRRPSFHGPATTAAMLLQSTPGSAIKATPGRRREASPGAHLFGSLGSARAEKYVPPDANLRKISAFIEQELLDDESKEQKKIPKKSLLAAMEKAAAAEETPRKQGRGCSLLELPESVDKKRDSACRIEDWANQPGARKALSKLRKNTTEHLDQKDTATSKGRPPLRREASARARKQPTRDFLANDERGSDDSASTATDKDSVSSSNKPSSNKLVNSLLTGVDQLIKNEKPPPILLRQSSDDRKLAKLMQPHSNRANDKLQKMNSSNINVGFYFSDHNDNKNEKSTKNSNVPKRRIRTVEDVKDVTPAYVADLENKLDVSQNLYETTKQKFNEMRSVYMKELSALRDDARNDVVKERLSQECRRHLRNVLEEPLMFFEPSHFILEAETKEFLESAVAEKVKLVLLKKHGASDDDLASITEMKALVAALEEKVEETTSKFEQEKEKCEKAKSDLFLAKETLQKRNEELSKKTQEAAELKTENEEMQKLMQEMKKEMRELRRENSKLNEQLSETKQKLAQAEHDLELEKAANEDLTKKNTQLTTQNENLTEKNENLETQNASLNEDLDNSKQECEKMHSLSQELDEKLTKSQSELEEALEEIEKLKPPPKCDAATQADDEFNTPKESVDDEGYKQLIYQEQLFHHEAKLEQTLKQLKNLENSLEKANSDLEKAKRELKDAAKNAVAPLKEKVEKPKEEIKKKSPMKKKYECFNRLYEDALRRRKEFHERQQKVLEQRMSQMMKLELMHVSEKYHLTATDGLVEYLNEKDDLKTQSTMTVGLEYLQKLAEDVEKLPASVRSERPKSGPSKPPSRGQNIANIGTRKKSYEKALLQPTFIQITKPFPPQMRKDEKNFRPFPGNYVLDKKRSASYERDSRKHSLATVSTNDGTVWNNANNRPGTANTVNTLDTANSPLGEAETNANSVAGSPADFDPERHLPHSGPRSNFKAGVVDCKNSNRKPVLQGLRPPLGANVCRLEIIPTPLRATAGELSKSPTTSAPMGGGVGPKWRSPLPTKAQLALRARKASAQKQSQEKQPLVAQQIECPLPEVRTSIAESGPQKKTAGSSSMMQINNKKQPFNAAVKNANQGQATSNRGTGGSLLQKQRPGISKDRVGGIQASSIDPSSIALEVVSTVFAGDLQQSKNAPSSSKEARLLTNSQQEQEKETSKEHILRKKPAVAIPKLNLNMQYEFFNDSREFHDSSSCFQSCGSALFDASASQHSLPEFELGEFSEEVYGTGSSIENVMKEINEEEGVIKSHSSNENENLSANTNKGPDHGKKSYAKEGDKNSTSSGSEEDMAKLISTIARPQTGYRGAILANNSSHSSSKFGKNLAACLKPQPPALRLLPSPTTTSNHPLSAQNMFSKGWSTTKNQSTVSGGQNLIQRNIVPASKSSIENGDEGSTSDKEVSIGTSTPPDSVATRA